MKKIHLVVLGLLSIVCSSCYSYKVYPKEYRKLENNIPKRSAYVIKDTLATELEILASSGLFEIVADSTKADVTIKLHPIEKSLVCGQPIILSMLTLGQLPALLPDRYLYTFEEIEDGIITKQQIELQLAKRIWFWDLFAFNKKFTKKAGEALLGTYQSSQ